MSILKCLKARFGSKKQRTKLQWRKMNPDNYTNMSNHQAISHVHVGKMTYGDINVFCYGKNDGQLYIGNYCSIAADVTFHLSGNHDMSKLMTYPVEAKCYGEEASSLSKGNIIIDDDVWIGYRATILSGVHIAQGAVVAAGAVVTRNVPPYAIVAGVPAKVLKYRFSEAIIKSLMQIDYSRVSAEFIKKHKRLFMHSVDESIIDSVKEELECDDNGK